MNRIALALIALFSSSYVLPCALNNCASTDIVAGQVQSAAGTPSGTAVTVQGNAGGIPIPVTASITPSSDYTIASTPITAANSNLNSGTPTTNSFAVSGTMSSVSTASFVVTGTFVATLVIQYSTDTSNWVSLPNVYNVNTGAAAANITAVGTYQVPVPASAQVRVTASAYTSGTATVQGRVSSGNSSLVAQAITGTIAATQSGTWTVQPGNTANTTAWKVDGSAVTQPVSASSLPLPALAATSTKQSDGTQKSQIVDGSGNVIGSTSNALDINVKSGNPTSITANAGANLNTSALALDASVTGLQVAQGATTSGQKGILNQGAVTTSAPSYTTAQTSPLSLDTSGNLRVITSTSATGATAANQSTEITALNAINTNTATTPYKVILGQGATTPTSAASNCSSGAGCNLIDSTAAGLWTDVRGYGAVWVRITGGASISAGVLTFETADDSSGTGSMAILCETLGPTNSGTFLSSLTPAANSNYGISCSPHNAYIRVRVSTTFTGGTIAAAAFASAAPPTAVTASQFGTWTTQPGNTANTTPWLNTLTPVVSPLSSSSPNEATVSTAYEASHVVKASAGVLYSLLCYNSKTSTQFLLTFNSTTVPADTAVTVTAPVPCPASWLCTLDFGNYGKYYSTGISWSNSSTSPTKTIGSSDMFCEPRYQ